MAGDIGHSGQSDTPRWSWTGAPRRHRHTPARRILYRRGRIGCDGVLLLAGEEGCQEEEPGFHGIMLIDLGMHAIQSHRINQNSAWAVTREYKITKVEAPRTIWTAYVKLTGTTHGNPSIPPEKWQEDRSKGITKLPFQTVGVDVNLPFLVHASAVCITPISDGLAESSIVGQGYGFPYMVMIGLERNRIKSRPGNTKGNSRK